MKPAFVLLWRDSLAFAVFKRRLVGLTGLEPVTLRLSSACSNQLSSGPGRALFKIANRKSQMAIEVQG